MLRATIITFLSLVTITSATVEITEYYNDAKCAVAPQMDDMYRDDPAQNPEIRWDNFINQAAWAAEAGIVLSSATIVGKDILPTAFADISAEMVANPLHHIGNHSWSHPSTFDDTPATLTLEYETSKEILESDVTYPDRFTYKGNQYLNFMFQWGGMVGFDYADPADWAKIQPTLARAGYLGVRVPLVEPYNYDLPWSSEYEMFSPKKTTDYRTSIHSGTFVDKFDHAYTNKGFYTVYTHPWSSEDYYLGGVYDAEWAAWRAYIGNRPDVWYTDLNSFYQYKYLQAVNPPTISEQEWDGLKIVTVTGDPVARAKHGLSIPLTYKISKPAELAASDDYFVSVKEAGGAWVTLPKKTAFDMFTGINCYRNDGTNVLVSQGLPEYSDSFAIQISRRGGKHMPALFGRSN